MAVKQTLTLTQVSQDVLQNTSQFRILWKSTQSGDSYNVNKRTAYYWVSINGGPEEEYSVSYKLNKKTTDTIVDNTITIPHDDHGKAEVHVRTWMDTRISAGEIELSKSLVLTDIPRAALISATDAYIGSKSTVIVGNLVTGYAVSIAYQFGEMAGFIDPGGHVTDQEVQMSVSAINFALPESFYGQIPNDPSGICTLTCHTYAGGVQLGENVCTFTATANPAICEPVVVAVVKDVNEVTLALTGDNGVLIQGKSIAECDATAEPRNGASITEINICGTVLQEGHGTVEIPNVQTGIFEFTATDSRGYIGRSRIELPVVPYSGIACTAAAGRTDPTSGNGWVTVEGMFFNGSFGAVDNALQVTIHVNGNTMQYSPTIEGNRYSDRLDLTGLDYTKSHTVEIVVSDAVEDVSKNPQILPGIPVFDWGEKDFKFNVPVDVAGLSISGVSLADYIRSIIEGG